MRTLVSCSVLALGVMSYCALPALAQDLDQAHRRAVAQQSNPAPEAVPAPESRPTAFKAKRSAQRARPAHVTRHKGAPRAHMRHARRPVVVHGAHFGPRVVYAPRVERVVYRAVPIYVRPDPVYAPPQVTIGYRIAARDFRRVVYPALYRVPTHHAHYCGCGPN